MKIIEPTVELITPATKEEGVEKLRFIERMARISHRSEGGQTSDTWKRFITSVVMERGDWSVVEHASATAVFRVDRGVTHELVRHRLFSFTQESTRFVNGRKSYPNGLEFIVPEILFSNEYDRNNYFDALAKTEHTYLTLLDKGIRSQEARSVLPNALASTIAVTGNLRSWHHVLSMRTTRETHPQFRKVMEPLLKDFQSRIPILFDGIIPGRKQSDAMGINR